MSNTISNSQLAAAIAELVDRWNTRENQMISLLSQPSGTVVVTDGLGQNRTLPSFPQLQADVTALVASAAGAVALAEGHANTALQHRNAAADSADAAETAAVRAEAAAELVGDVEAAADAAASSAAASASSAVAATASASDAAGSASNAASSASSAATSAATVASAASASSASASAAAISATAASGSATSASSSATSATASSTAAGTAASNAASSASAAAASATSAASSAASAGTAATTAGASATSATASASAASGSASSAAASASSATAASTAAASSAVKADSFANAGQNVEVEPGLYSARHWALQAQASSTGALIYMGSWSAAGGAYPGSPSKGHFYKVSAAGNVGGTEFGVGDQIVHNGTSWDKIDNTEAVSSVAGKVGLVTLVTADIGGLQTALDGKAASSHTHTIANVTGLQTALDSKLNASAFTWENLGSKPTTLAGFGITDAAAASHTHAIANVIGLQTALDGKAASSHTHTIANVTGLQTALDGKAASSHQHSGTDITSGTIADARLPTSMGAKTFTGEVVTTSANSFRMAIGSYGAFWRQDGSSLYLLLTASGDPNGSWNTLRPFSVNLGSGDVLFGQMTRFNGVPEVLNATGAAYVRVPRIFVGGSDPGSTAADGDLWIT